MIYQSQNDVPDVFPEGYFYSGDLYLYLIIVVLGFIGSVIFLKRANRKEVITQKAIFRAMSFLFLMLTLMRIFYLIAVWIPGLDYDLYVTLGYITGLFGMGLFLFQFEKYIIKKTKFILTGITWITVIIALLALTPLIPRDVPRLITSAVTTADTLLIVIVYLYLIRMSTGIIRQRTIISTIGIFLFFIGIFMDSEIFFGLWQTMPLILPPLLSLLGLLIIIPIMRY